VAGGLINPRDVDLVQGHMPGVGRDLLQGFRLVLRAPGFAATAALTLALGIGATTALFSVVNAVLLDPLPFPGSSRLVQVWRAELPALTYGSASYPRYLDWRANQREFTEFGAWAPRGFTLAGREGPERVAGAIASASFFRVIGAPPAVGRWIGDDEDRPGGERVAVLSHGLWLRRFRADPAVLGTTVLLDGQPYTVIGVAPAAFAEVWRTELWVPLAPMADAGNRGSNYLLSFGRLRDGTTLESARRSLDELAVQMGREHPEDEYTFTARAVHDVVTEGATRGLWVLLGATALLLLIACTNVANLLLARAVVRERDLAVRASLGASRGQLVGQVMGETVALGLLGSAAGLGLAWALLRAFVASAPANFPRLAAIGLDLRVLGFAGVAAMVAGLVAGLAPALHLLRADVNAVVRAGASRSVTAGRARAASRLLVVSEVALALALLTTAGLMTKSLLRLQDQDLGMTREPVLTFTVGLPPFVAGDDAAVARLQTAFMQRIRTIPGVTQASAIDMLPVAATGHNGPVRRADQTGERDGVPVTEVRVVMDGYASAMGLRVLAGRAIDDRDRPGSVPVAVVNDTVAARLWPDRPLRDVIGQQLRVEALEASPVLREVVGVVAGVRSRRPDLPSDPEVHAPFAQLPVASMSYVVRADGDPSRLTAPIRTALAEMMPDVALAAVRTFDDVVTNATRTSGLLSRLSVLFGALAVVLAVVGIYGVMSYTVAQRERELAIRAAVGATRSTLLALVVREGLAMSAAGIAAGALVAWAASGVLRSLLYDVSATDAAVFTAAAVGLAAVTLAGYLLPATRASRVEPVSALRAE
jgi:putative ABC transport system permease protein